MANALGTLFGDIASAIREKTGDTATMKPAEFPEKIAAIEAGGGGGSLPSDIYLSKSPIPLHGHILGKRYYFKGELYAGLQSSNTSGYFQKLYKWNGSSWVLLLSTSSITTGINGIMTNATDDCVEFNGKLHFISGKNHSSFDGANLVKHNTLPNITEGCKACVYQNKLIAYIPSKQAIYEWNESADTWSEMAVISTNTYSYWQLFTKNDILYGELSKKIYRYENGSFVEQGSISARLSSSFSFNGDVYYYSTYTNYIRLWKYDAVTNTETLVGDLPLFRSMIFTYGGEELSFIGSTTTPSATVSNMYFPCYVIHKVSE